MSDISRVPRAQSRVPNFRGMSFDQQLEVVHSVDVEPRRHLARSPYASWASLHALSQDPDTEVVLAVANNRNTQPRTLGHLIKVFGSRNLEIASIVASNPNTDASTLQRIMNGKPGFLVASIVSEHPNCPGELSQQIMMNNNPGFYR